MLSIAIKNRIVAAVDSHQADIVAFAQHLIRIDSVTGHEGPVQDYLASTLRRWGLTVDQFEPDLAALRGHPAFFPVDNLCFAGRPNVIATWKGTGGGRSLLFNGHVDTIPLEPLDAWTHGALSGAVVDDKVYGRGAADMKGGLAAMTMALRLLLDAGLRPRGDVILEYVVDEELTGYGTLAAVQRGYQADAGISLETSGLCIQPACIGRLWFTVTIKGLAVGIARHWEGVSAIDKGVQIVQAIKDLEQVRWATLRHPLYPDHRAALPCVVCMFNAGTFPSAVPDTAVLRGSLGLMPQEEVAEVEEQVRRQIAQATASDPWLRDHPPSVEFKRVGADGAEIPVDHPIVQTLAASYREVCATEPVVSGRTGGADTRYLIKYGQTPTVIFGPGRTSEMHALDEFVPIPNLVHATKVLALTIGEWCGVDGGS
jgi:acetylornithine deacetylase